MQFNGLKPKLVVFARAPVLSQVKTRLAITIGDQEALEVYRLLLENTLHQAVGVSSCTVLVYSDKPEHDYFMCWEGRGVTLKHQQGDDLGQRMLEVFKAEVQDNVPVLLVGADCPGFDSAYLENAVSILSQKNMDAVITPATDGGYVLIGLRACYAEAFQSIDWSSGLVFSQTVKRFEQLGLNWKQLPTLSDIDDYQDYLAWKSG